MSAVTPAEAAERLCPQKLWMTGPDAPRDGLGCEGPRCLAWRWMPDDGRTGEQRRRGYCGLAGPAGEPL